jgi:UDP-N-acetylglucosamine--N-acetylmuramyl-(pentapeptide) pyrophosphoryl-undecaprenol N-acetylglucosamine transferase
MAGGTGGHVFPALAVADVLIRKGVGVQWLGTARGIEAELVPQAGIPLNFVQVSGLRGKGLLAQIVAPLVLLRSLVQALNLIKRLRPACVLGLGGFASGPGGVAAWLLRVPLVIHEQNAVPGTTNRLLAYLAKLILLGYPDALRGPNVRFVGNPVRRAIAALAPPERRWAGRVGQLRLLVLGGSLGAKPINTVVPAAVAAMAPALRPEILHQTGRAHATETAALYKELQLEARVEPFIEDMAAAYAWADVVLCRAGALTVAELAAVGLGALLVPLPHAIDDHQTFNARWLTDHRAGVLVRQDELSAAGLAKQLGELAAQPQELLAWARAARSLAKPDAAEQVAQVCCEAGALEVAYG